MLGNNLDMYLNTLILYIYILYNKLQYIADASRKFVHQNDISEYCKRRVAPSIFLGQHIMDASSYVVQFSRLDVPYSCSFSVRAESGTNIILVVQLPSEENLFEACSMRGEQLVVYEFGETFGGYWGLIPKSMVEQPFKNYTQYYTLKTTRPPTKRIHVPKTTNELILTQTATQSTDKEQEYYTIEVPIVDVSGNFQLGPQRVTQDSDELFDFIYDVTPRTGFEYDTSVMPLVQFSIRPQGKIYDSEDVRYDIEYSEGAFTLDPRLIFNTAKRKKTSRRRIWKTKKKYRHRTKSTAMFLGPDIANNNGLFRDRLKINTGTLVPTLDSKYFTKSRQLIDDIMKSIKTSTTKNTIFQNQNFKDILSIISNTNHNSSVYLAPNISLYHLEEILTTEENKIIPKPITSNFFEDNTTSSVEPKMGNLDTSEALGDFEPKHISEKNLSLKELITDLEPETLTTEVPKKHTFENVSTEVFESNKENIIISNEIGSTTNSMEENITMPNIVQNEAYKQTRRSFQTGALVDHESWENIVKVAPVMAVVLNKTEPLTNKTDNNVIKDRRKKRHIQSLEVEDSHPKNLTRKPIITTNVQPFDDAEELVKIVELQDDEIGSRVVLRYLRHYVGPALFNLCEYHESNIRQIFLFNSSRIVISINNFSLDQMMLVLTPAQTLTRGVSQCPPDQLECQIIGTRVCIDSLNACDGIPNCGSNEIYDEDRLTCGTSHGVEHNVCIAAFTFLAVILTLLYITSYWLKRCVPRVSDAFFVYTDASENELFLDTVMRSPNDNDDPFNKHVYPGHYFEDDVFYDDIHAETNKGNFCMRAIKTCLRFLFCRTALPDNKTYNGQSKTREPSKLFSFTQLELQKIAKSDINAKAMQTREPIQVKEIDHEEDSEDTYYYSSWSKLKKDSIRHDSELNLIKFSKEKRTSSQNDSLLIDHKNRKDEKHIDGELEIKNTIYEPHTPKEGNKIPVTCEVHTDTKGLTETKRLRFDEQLQMIPRADDNDSVVTTSTIQKLHDEDLDKIEEDEENESFGRDFMRFWGAKGKKSRKKKHLPVRL